MESEHEWVEHTGELELSLGAPSPEGLFAAGAAALAELLAEHEAEADRSDAAKLALAVSVSAPDQVTLLAEWLSELAYHAESSGLVPERIDRLELAGTSLEATVAARKGTPPHLVKAVTYHRLAMWSEAGRWRARVVFDV